MVFEQIDRPKCKWEAAELLRSAQVSPMAMTALYMAFLILMDLISTLAPAGFAGIFIYIFTRLLNTVLGAGFVLYCMAIRRGERAEYLVLFDGFSFVGKLILLDILSSLFIFLWTLVFIFPGFIAAYRYRFAKFNLCENPGIGVLEALEMSKQQTLGYKFQLFTLDLSYLGWSLLAAFPALVLNFYINQEMIMELYLQGAASTITSFWGIPLLVWNLVLGLWQLAVAVFYLPNYLCVELSYFETAKRTSGIGEGAAPQTPSSPWDGWTPPDGLG